MDHSDNKGQIVAIGMIIAVLSFFIGWQSKSMMTMVPASETASDTRDRTTFSSEGLDFTPLVLVWDVLQESFIDAEHLDAQKLIYGAARGLVEAVDDPYTVFMTPEETAQFQTNLNGDLEGIGIEVTISTKQLVVVNILKNSPAEQEGVLTGDIIYAVDNKIAADMTFYDAITAIRGAPGTDVKLTVIRASVDEPLDFTITRERIEVPSVEWKMHTSTIAYMSVNQFSDNTLTQFSESLSGVLLADAQGLIIDLRSNGGGYLDIAVSMLSEFLHSDQKAVTIEKRDPSENEVIYVSGSPRLPNIPLVVLINGGSASASEIFAGAIQDYHRGFLIGEQSYGKGSVQEVQSLEDGSSLRVTIARWLTPNERNVTGVGLAPDQVVALTQEDRIAGKDPQFDAAVQYLTEFLENE